MKENLPNINIFVPIETAPCNDLLIGLFLPSFGGNLNHDEEAKLYSQKS